MSNDLPSELQHLQNIINGAKNQPNLHANILRGIVYDAADKAPDDAIIRLAELVLRLGIEEEQKKRADRN